MKVSLGWTGSIELNLHWRDVFNLINGIGGLKHRQGLNMNYSTSMVGAQDGKYGGVIWYAGNCHIVLISAEENISIIDMKSIDGTPADVEALRTWEKLKTLLSRYEIPEKSKIRELPKELTSRQKGLNKLAVIWAELNFGGKEKNYSINKFLEDEAQLHGLYMVTEFEFKKHLPKARDWGVIDQNPKTKRYIPIKK